MIVGIPSIICHLIDGEVGPPPQGPLFHLKIAYQACARTDKIRQLEDRSTHMNTGLPLTFEDWLRKQKNRDSPLGDLAKDYIGSLRALDDDTLTVDQTFERSHPCREAYKALTKAKASYRAYVKRFNEDVLK